MHIGIFRYKYKSRYRNKTDKPYNENMEKNDLNDAFPYLIC